MENKVEVEMEKEWNDLDLHVNLSFYTKNLSINLPFFNHVSYLFSICYNKVVVNYCIYVIN